MTRTSPPSPDCGSCPAGVQLQYRNYPFIIKFREIQSRRACRPIRCSSRPIRQSGDAEVPAGARHRARKQPARVRRRSGHRRSPPPSPRSPAWPAACSSAPTSSPSTTRTGDWAHPGSRRCSGVIMEHFMSGAPILTPRWRPATRTSIRPAPRRCRRSSCSTRVRPAVAADGGDITFRAYKDGIVYLNMPAPAPATPSSTATLRNGIQNLLRRFLPVVREVRAAITLIYCRIRHCRRRSCRPWLCLLRRAVTIPMKVPLLTGNRWRISSIGHYQRTI